MTRQVGGQMIRIATDLGIFAVLACLSSYGTSPPAPAGATHEGETILHCVEDPDANQMIDIFDLGEFAAAFGQQPAPEYSDIDPPLVPDGNMSVIGELNMVATLFGKPCIGNRGTIPDSPVPPEFAGLVAAEGVESINYPRAYNCRFGTEGHGVVTSGGPTGQQVIISPTQGGYDWGGGVFCYVNNGFYYRFTCLFTWMQIQPGPNLWDLVAATVPNGFGFYPGQAVNGGLYCQRFPSQYTAFVPCFYNTLGWLDLVVEYSTDYQTWHQLYHHHEPEQSFGFEPCFGI